MHALLPPMKVILRVRFYKPEPDTIVWVELTDWSIFQEYELQKPIPVGESSIFPVSIHKNLAPILRDFD